MSLTRRGFLQFVAAAGVSGTVFALFPVGRAGALPRPPGALTEEAFLSLCSRCLQCVDVCQPLALRPAGLFEGVANLGSPVLDVSKCIICMECVRVCPTGALQKIPKKEVDLGTAVILKEICLAWQNKKRCRICYEACPTKAIVLDRKRNPVLISENCNGCGICYRKCPTEPKSVTISYQGAKRFDPPEGRFALRLEDRVGPYEFPPPDFRTWFVNRVRTLAEKYGILGRNP
ncbi:MAG: 4Fe-4S binding protein [Deltaproteobacteria bacterium]|nr:4Fe-4S binding protein [Deltaproteobacteria bacterium]